MCGFGDYPPENHMTEQELIAAYGGLNNVPAARKDAPEPANARDVAGAGAGVPATALRPEGSPIEE